ncbi:MAG: protein serine/threonine phosphatase 2C family protein [Deltaproteobacteria bacterium]|nr:protein serine/threonine phosphatase 2C family protein [Deltaproteobacteria bacterium]
MLPIAVDDPLRVGDVVHHPAFGFATLAEVDERGARLRWHGTAAAHPTYVSRHGLSTSYRKCRPGSLLARRAAEPDKVRRMAQEDPVAILGLLLVDLGDAQPLDHAHDWMRQVVGDQGMEGNGFDGWWNAILSLASVDGRFRLDEDRIGLSPGVHERDFTTPVAVPAALPPEPAATALSRGPRVDYDPDAIFASACKLAEALAALHARGDSLLHRRDASHDAEAGWQLAVDPEPQHPADSVHWAARRLVEELLGLEIPDIVPPQELVDALPGAVPSVPAELLGVLRRCLARDQALRPRNGLEWALQLAQAHASFDARRRLPRAAGAALCVGFDTHIGTLKALVGQANQDAFVVLGEPDMLCFAVADGISTSTAGSGDLASSLFVRTLRLQWTAHHENLRGAGPEEAFRFLCGALERANRVICEAASCLAHDDISRHVPMGTTAIVGLSVGDSVYLAALGDSRALLCGRHGVAPLAWDQNLNAMRLRQAAQGNAVPWDDHGYALVGYLGHFDETGEPSLPPPILVATRLLPGEWLVLASDGLSDHAAPEEAGVYAVIEATLARHGRRADPASAMAVARRLVLAANEGTGGDNITVLALTLSSKAAGNEENDPVQSESEN